MSIFSPKFSFSFRWQKWCDICVGDIVRLRKESFVPVSDALGPAVCLGRVLSRRGSAGCSFPFALQGRHALAVQL